MGSTKADYLYLWILIAINSIVVLSYVNRGSIIPAQIGHYLLVGQSCDQIKLKGKHYRNGLVYTMCKPLPI